MDAKNAKRLDELWIEFLCWKMDQTFHGEKDEYEKMADWFNQRIDIRIRELEKDTGELCSNPQTTEKNHAEKGLVLTWEDIRKIVNTYENVLNDKEFNTLPIKDGYTEVLKRFNESRTINRRSYEKQEYKDRVDRNDMESGDGMHQGK